MEINEEIKDLIILQLCGDISEEANRQLSDWIAASPDHATYFSNIREIWFSSGADQQELSKYDKDRAFDIFKKNAKTQRAKVIPIIYKVAAAIAVLFVITYTSIRYGENLISNKFSNIAVEAPLGATTNIVLPDGSKVALNAGSRIEYSQGFGVTDRQVKLSGEGHFEIAHRENLVFTVKSQNICVNDVGTVFDFKDYPQDDIATVTLIKGKVDVSNSKESLRLAPGERVVLDKATMLFTKEMNESANSSWQDGHLSLNGESFTRISQELERRYNVKIQIKNDSIKSLHFNGDFNTSTQSVEDVLTQLAKTGKLHFRKSDNLIVIY